MKSLLLIKIVDSKSLLAHFPEDKWLKYQAIKE